MAKDIEKIIQQVRRLIPSVQVVQMDKYNPGDDDGLWWFRLPGVKQDIQVESATGNCPFTVESDDSQGPVNVGTIDEVVRAIVSYLKSINK